MSMDIKPKHLIKIIFPLIAVIFLSLIYVGYTDLKSSKEDAYEQARTNIKVAREYLELHFNAAENQLFLLNELLNKRFSIADFLASAQHVVDQQPKFSEIGLYTGGNYYATNGVTVTEATERVKTRPWFQVSREAGETYLSPIYMSRSTKKWSVTLVKVARSYEGRLVHVLLEMDATGLYQQLSLLKTLEHGYLYAVDLSNRQVVMHPDERRIATPSVSVSPELIEKIRSGQLKGTIDNYMYQMQWKFSVYDADNPFGWVLLSGTIKQDITAKAFNLGAVGLALVAIIAIMVIVRFTSMLIHNNGRNLIEVNELSELNQQLTKMIHGLLPCNQVMLFVYDEVANEFVDVTCNHHFSYVDVASYLPVTKHRSMRVNKHDPYDVIARTIAPHQNVIRVPLTKQQHVQGIIYILGATAKTPWVVNIYRNYAQGALNHVLLRQQIQNKDQMTGLMNKNYLRIQLQQTLQCERKNYYLAMMDIDDFKMINDGLGHLFGDEVIMTVAEKLKRFLPQNSTAARYGGDEFSIMFQADSFADAKAKLSVLRDRISLHRVSYENKECQFTMSIGCAPVTGDLDSVISAADTALYEAKGKKRPKVCKHDMLDGPCQFYEPKDGSDPQMLCTGKNSIVA